MWMTFSPHVIEENLVSRPTSVKLGGMFLFVSESELAFGRDAGAEHRVCTELSLRICPLPLCVPVQMDVPRDARWTQSDCSHGNQWAFIPIFLFCGVRPGLQGLNLKFLNLKRVWEREYKQAWPEKWPEQDRVQ